MTKRTTTRLAISVRERLLNLSRQRQENYNLILVRYANERFLFRLSQSPFAPQFVLKGAILFAVWGGEPHRPTLDIDLLGFGDNSPEALRALFATICELPVVDDGLTFDAHSIRIEDIREAQEYGGKRVALIARLDTAVISVQVDIGFGDIVTPGAVWLTYPTLLSFPEPHLRTYPKESVVAEKLQAMVMLGMANSRMKDFYDLWTLSREYTFESDILIRAIEATFNQRQTVITMPLPLALTETFAEHPEKIKQWQAFLNRNKLDIAGVSLGEVVTELREFLLPLWQALALQQDFRSVWTASRSWGLERQSASYTSDPRDE